MHLFSTKAVLLSFASLAIADSCTEGPFVKDPPKAGVLPPSPACHTRWDNGEVIVGVEAWAAKFQMKAIRFKYSQQGWGPTLGTVDKHSEYHAVGEWSASEKISIRMWNNKPDDGDPVDAVGWIQISKKKNGEKLLDIGGDPKKTAKTENYGANMGGEMILGARVGSGAWLDYLEFNMLKSPVEKAELTDVKMNDRLEDVNKKQQGIDNVDLKTMYFVNENPKNGSNMIYGQHMSTTEKTRKEITTETTNEWSAGVSITVGASVGIPLISANVETTTSVGYANTEFKSETLEEEDVETLEWDFRCDPETPLPPQRAAKCVARSTSGDYKGSYVGTVKVELKDGSTYSYKEAGEVTSLSFLDASASCKEIDLKDVPSGATVGETEEVKNEKRNLQHLRVFRP
ncbi:unnamed protein product [Periconia digitata]|uniref:Uncharacterized protein n=1 Tax=Periconia digitata TaxID=1303443 RepID=A0A9W4XQJ9_9PLEO|nr:unnamed protein product [Periconia digitata]